MTHPASTIRRSREIEREVTGHATSDGAGVRLTRVLTQDLQRRLDPFLLLDAFGSDDPNCLLYTSPSPRDGLLSRMPSSA